MKVLVFHIGADRYGLPLALVRRVLPLMELKALPLAPDAVAGLMNLHGASVPVIDLCRISGGAPAAQQVDTRILLVDYHTPEGALHALGLLAEKVQGVQEVDTAALNPSGVAAAPFLGAVAGDAAGIVQLVRLEELLPPSLRALLFRPEDQPS
ncbi:chemotaxis protein CheW [Pseudoduganella violacea]|uniref:Chemotaxis-related protein WspB n=1 Tax=Pseudoduganella violacea TaxID=1715466 RepID=A0A7W5FWP7_9BURK|nr:chemotaxis protein CheW [Pseudoduganella violacea]MBB3122061.1 chemotaxis-related protein WspB [Pseudoduganella violacea]